MPDKTFVFDQIKKLMGWCPACKKMAQQTKQSFNFANVTPISGKTGNIPEFRISNVIFPANSNLVFVLFYIGISLLLRYPEDITLFLAGLLLLNTCYYFLYLKTFEAAVLVDRFGVHLQTFRLKNIEIIYEEIESVTSYRLEKRSKKMSLLLIIGGIAICGFIIYYMAAVKGEWRALLLLVSVLPLVLFAEKNKRLDSGT